MSDDYIRAYIPACEGFGWTGGPGFSTTIVTKRNGRERRNADWAQPQHSYSLPFNALTQEAYAPVKEMHLNRRGAWGVFLHQDRLDSSADEDQFGVGDGEQTVFQLAKRSVLDGVAYQRSVYALYNPREDGSSAQAEPVVKISGVATPVTVDYDRGLVQFASAPPALATLTWTGDFSLWVRFVSDKLPFTIFDKGAAGFYVQGSIDLLEMPPPIELTS